MKMVHFNVELATELKSLHAAILYEICLLLLEIANCGKRNNEKHIEWFSLNIEEITRRTALTPNEIKNAIKILTNHNYLEYGLDNNYRFKREAEYV